MPRPRRDQTPARKPQRRKLTDAFVRQVPAPEREPDTWIDTLAPALQLRVHPTGHRTWRVSYRVSGQPTYYTIKGLLLVEDARRKARKVLVQVDDGLDPAAERRAEKRGQGSFAELADRYRDEFAKTRNKSWKRARRIVERVALPAWGNRQAASITMEDVERLIGRIDSPSSANGALDNISAIFNWAVKKKRILAVNPCSGIDRHEVTSRERIASDSEIPKLLAAFEKAGMRGLVLKTILLTGQRGGEVRYMRREHLRDGWWEMPGPPVPELGWPGTKNGHNHRVWLPQPVQKIIRELGDEPTGFVFTSVHNIANAMRDICSELGITEKITPHDLRRTHGSTITGLGFGRDAMNRVQNHREGGITDVYDRHDYSGENKRIMEKVAQFLLEGPASNVVVIDAFTSAA
jgi:integrase